MSTSEMPGTNVGRPTSSERRRTGGAWRGWVAFAAVMAFMLGVYHVVQGLIAIFNDEYFLVGSSGLVVSLDFTVWGWLHLLLGLVAIAAAYGLVQGAGWGRVLAICLAVLSAVVNLGFLAAYPLWSTLIIAFDVIVIYALTVHWDAVTD